MFGTLRRHQNKLWIAAIPFIIVSFVIFFSPNVSFMGGRPKQDMGSINGRPITREEYFDAQTELAIFVYFRTGKWPQGKADFEAMNMNLTREIYNRILLAELIRQQKIDIGSDAVAAWISQVFKQGESQPFDLKAYQNMIKTIGSHGATEDDFERFARIEVGRQHLVAVFGGSGRLLTPAEGEAAYRREHEEFVTEIVTFPATNYLAQVPADPVAISNFFNLRQADYWMPEQRSVEFVRFTLTNYHAAVEKTLAGQTNLEMGLEMEYTKRGTNNFKDATGRVMSRPEALAQIRKELHSQLSVYEGRKAAFEILTLVFDEMQAHPTNRTALQTIAASKGLAVQNTLLFDRESLPPELNVPPGFTEAAFGLSAEKPLATSPVIGEDAVYVVGLRQVVPSRPRSFDEVRTQVIDDYRQQEAKRLAEEAAGKFSSSLTNAPGKDQKFSAVAAAAGLKVTKVPPFSLTTTTLPESSPAVNLRLLQRVATSLKTGESTPYIGLGEVGMIIHLESRLPIDAAKMKAELPEFLIRVQEQRQMQAFIDWVNRQSVELKLSLPAGASS
jgi:hypothetical protein